MRWMGVWWIGEASGPRDNAAAVQPAEPPCPDQLSQSKRALVPVTVHWNRGLWTVDRRLWTATASTTNYPHNSKTGNRFSVPHHKYLSISPLQMRRPTE